MDLISGVGSQGKDLVFKCPLRGMCSDYIFLLVMVPAAFFWPDGNRSVVPNVGGDHGLMVIVTTVQWDHIPGQFAL